MWSHSVEGDSFTFVFTAIAALIYLYFCGTDWLYRKIPNTGILLLMGITIPFSLMTKGVLQSGMNILLGVGVLVIFLPFYIYRKMGAGDVKLLAITTILIGTADIGEFAFWLLIASFGICFMTVIPLPKLLWFSVLHYAGRPELQNRYPTMHSVPYGIPISLSAIMCLFNF